jgi:MSHA pilin protein MshD
MCISKKNPKSAIHIGLLPDVPMPLGELARAFSTKGMSAQRGISLIELIMFIVIVSVALAGILLVMNTTTKSSADPLINKQALAIAESLLEEVELMPFTYCDPDDANAANATAATTAQCPAASGVGGVENMGPEAGETRGSATPFDNVNDYNGFSMAGANIKDIAGNVIGNLTNYAASVTVTAIAYGSITLASGDALLIKVDVTGPAGNSVTLEGIRTRYAPRAVP